MKTQGKQGSAMLKHRRFLFDDEYSWRFPFPFRARHIFVSVCTNCLNVALAMLCTICTIIYQKCDTRKIHAVSVNRP